MHAGGAGGAALVTEFEICRKCRTGGDVIMFEGGGSEIWEAGLTQRVSPLPQVGLNVLFTAPRQLNRFDMQSMYRDSAV